MKKKLITNGFILLFLSMFLTLSVNAQDPANMPRFGKDSANAVVKLSLYQEFYSQWKASKYKSPSVNDALVSWRWLFKNAPKASENLYINGKKIYKHLLSKAKDKNRKEGIIDTLLLIYDQRMKYFPTNRKGKDQVGKILGYKGIELAQARPSEHEQIFDILSESVKKCGNKSQSAVLVYYFRSAIGKVKDGKADKTLIVDTYDQVSNIIDFNLKKYKDNKKRLGNWENVKGNIENSFEPYATCEDLTSIYQKKYDEASDNVEVLEKITTILSKKDCVDSQLFLEATKKLHALKPSAASAEKMGKMLYKKENYDEAVKYFEQAIELYDNNDDKIDVYKMLAGIAQMRNQYSKTRSYAYKVLELNPNDGMMYIIIGDLYASSAAKCGDNELTSKVAYLAAVDKYIKARNVDASVKDEANKRIATYSRYFPRKETVFFYGLKTGEPYKVGCWINENTTIRTAD